MRLGISKLDVFIQLTGKQVPVGRLVLNDRKVFFKYHDDYLRTGFNISPLKLKFDNSIQYASSVPFDGLFGVFDDSLPDGWGFLLLSRKLQESGVSIEELNPLDMLAFMGDMGRGALVYKPSLCGRQGEVQSLDIDDLRTEILKVYEGTSSEVLNQLFELGGTSGGARPKVNVGYNSQTGEIISELEEFPSGFEHWIIKFPSGNDPLDIANIEYGYYLMATEAGIEMVESKLFESSKGKFAFGTKRFDRLVGKRLHMHSLAGLVHDDFRMSTLDYGHILNLAYQLEKTAVVREKVFRLMVFNVLAHNRDDHSKNFSWLMDSSGKWEFAPAYDLTFSSSSHGEHSTRVAGVGSNPSTEQLLELANLFSIKSGQKIIDEVKNVVSRWMYFANKAGVSKDSSVLIQNKLKTII